MSDVCKVLIFPLSNLYLIDAATPMMHTYNCLLLHLNYIFKLKVQIQKVCKEMNGILLFLDFFIAFEAFPVSFRLQLSLLGVLSNTFSYFSIGTNFTLPLLIN